MIQCISCLLLRIHSFLNSKHFYIFISPAGCLSENTASAREEIDDQIKLQKKRREKRKTAEQRDETSRTETQNIHKTSSDSQQESERKTQTSSSCLALITTIRISSAFMFVFIVKKIWTHCCSPLSLSSLCSSFFLLLS